MFAFLLNLPASHAISSIYEAIRLIRHRLNLENFDPVSEEEKLARQIIAEIQEKEGIQLSGLSDASAEHYTFELADIGQDKIRRELNYDQERGRQLLEEMRLASAHEANVIAPRDPSEKIGHNLNHQSDNTLIEVEKSKQDPEDEKYHLTERELQDAFRLAYYLHPSRTEAFKVTLAACHRFWVVKSQEKRAFVSSRSYRQRIPHEGLLQICLYQASDALERIQEQPDSYDEIQYQPTQDDLIIRYVKFLVSQTLRRNSSYIAVGLGCFLYTYHPIEIAQLLAYSEVDTRHTKKRILKDLQSRFDRYHIIRDGKLITKPPDENENMLVRESLSMFAPWLPADITAPNKNRLLNTYFGAESEKTEWERSHVLIDPVNAGLARLIREHNERSNKDLEDPEKKLEIPVFHEVPSDNRDRFELYSLRDHEIALVQKIFEEKIM